MVKGTTKSAIATTTACGCDSDPYFRPASELILLGSKQQWFHRGGTGRRGMDVLPHLDWLKDVWYIPNAARADHPAPFPLELPRRLIRLFAHAPDAIICDPMMGSGTVGVAARQVGRAFVGNDRQAAFVDVARNRIVEAVFTETAV